jgi:hypothetical protein
LPGAPINFPGFNVLRLSGGPWCIVFNPGSGSGSLHVNDTITVSLDPRLFVAHALPSSGAVTTLFKSTNGMLQLQGQPGSSPSYQVVVDSSVWTFPQPFPAVGYRSGVLTEFDGFLQQAEIHEPGTLQPGATEALRALLAPQIPATYAESLYLSYGVFSKGNPPRGYFDVQPGMRLGVEFEARQYVPPTAGTGPLSGFVSASTVMVDVVSQGGLSSSGVPTPRLGLDAFFSAVRLPPMLPPKGGAGGVIDLVASAAALASLRHLRVCYPALSFPNADDGGIVGAAGNMALLGAADLATLATATDTYYLTGAPATGTLVGYFRGRTVIRAYIPLLVNGTQLRYVPIGTTIRQLLEPLRVLPRLPGIVDSNASVALNYQRYLPGLGVTELYDSSHAYQQLTLADGDGVDAFGADVLDVPVLAGDTLSLPSFPSSPPGSPSSPALGSAS